MQTITRSTLIAMCTLTLAVTASTMFQPALAASNYVSSAAHCQPISSSSADKLGYWVEGIRSIGSNAKIICTFPRRNVGEAPLSAGIRTSNHSTVGCQVAVCDGGTCREEEEIDYEQTSFISLGDRIEALDPQPWEQISVYCDVDTNEEYYNIEIVEPS